LLMLLVLWTTSFTWPDNVGDRYGPSFIVYHCLYPHLCAADSTLSYGGDDPDSKFQCLLGHVKHRQHRQFSTSQWVCHLMHLCFYLNSSPCSPDSKCGY
jgi:hypothetical protein